MWKVVFLFLAATFAIGTGVMVGGVSDGDINDEGAKKALNFAVDQHNSRTNDMYLRQVAEVVKVQKQVVAGIKYIITVKMARTLCRKNGTGEECTIPEDPAQAQPYQCKFGVWSRPWLKEMTVVEEKCN
ncbi:cystatin-C [Oryzias melastigma]|uniref:cystatin-C n=1 Tax=Oryzias melastigma TaxID=30732 RepID=UPI000CF82CF6|nr:cystatin-C [Oryzias melastigma]